MTQKPDIRKNAKPPEHLALPEKKEGFCLYSLDVLVGQLHDLEGLKEYSLFYAAIYAPKADKTENKEGTL